MNANLKHQFKKAADQAGISIGGHDGSPYPTYEQLLTFALALGVLPASDGLFDGLLENLLSSQRHTDRYFDRMRELASADVPDREHLRRVVDEAMTSLSKHQQSCAEFIRLFGDRLVLKEKA